MMTKPKDDPRSKKERIAEAIMACEARVGAAVLPEVVVREARDPSSILHDQFDWNDAREAHRARLMRARELIRESREIVVYRRRTLAMPRYISDPRTMKSSYVRAVTIASNRPAKLAAVQREVRFARAIITRILSLAVGFRLEPAAAVLSEILQRLDEVEALCAVDPVVEAAE